MTTPPLPLSTPRQPVGRAVLVTWLVTAAWDFLCASALSVFAYHSTFSRLWQGVAAAAVGPRALQMGARGVAAGLVLHLLVALTWSAAFVLALSKSIALHRALRRPVGALGVAAVYGPVIWLVMSLAVIPLATGKLPTFGFRWWVQIFAHVPFVTLPLVFTARRALGLGGGERAGAGDREAELAVELQCWSDRVNGRDKVVRPWLSHTNWDTGTNGAGTCRCEQGAIGRMNASAFIAGPDSRRASCE